ncbi:MAG: RICIN domain-containing protein [Candidatus Acidiferrales bacterium]
MRAQQPAEPLDITPLNGETYYLINQSDGLQMDNASSISSGANILQQTASYTSLSQRWSVTKLANGSWEISNLMNGLCLDMAANSVVQNPCTVDTPSQEWSLNPVLTPAGNSTGYYTVQNQSTGLLLDTPSSAAGAQLDETASDGAQSQKWLLRPVFFRGIDGALLEKQEAARASQTPPVPWWKDAGAAFDVLQLFKNHGINLVRLRPSSAPPYANPSQTGCSGNLCYAETDAQDLDEAKRAKNLGMSVELTLLFDGGSSSSMPAAWAADASNLTNLEADIRSYVKQEIETYRRAGVMPDLVSIGNEVDTGFLNSNYSPTGANFSPFAQLQIAAMLGVSDAATDTSDPSLGPALPRPLTCIHITPAWDLTQFFTLANQNAITYDAICQSYYPLYHGPLTSAQAAASNPGNKPIEQSVLNNAAGSIGKPIFVIEAGEHYETGFGSTDPWYSPTEANQRQFLVDLDSVLRDVPNNLAMGMEYWDPEGVNIPNPSGGFLNGDNQPNAIYAWNGLTIFDNADGGTNNTNVSASNYSALLPAADALGGKFDPSLRYKLINGATGKILESQGGSSASGASLDTATDTGIASLYQQWLISSDGDGYFRITSANSTNVLDDSGGAASAGSPIVQASAAGSQEQEWNVVTAGGGYFSIVNRVSGLVLDINSSTGLAIQQTLGTSTPSQQWQIVPVHVTAAGSPGFLISVDPPTVAIKQGAQGAVVVTLTPSGGYAGTATFTCAGLPTNATCAFSSSPVTFDGKDSVQTTTLTITTQAAAAAPLLLRFPWQMPPWPSAFSPVALILLVAWLFFASRKQTALVLRLQLAPRIRLLLLILAAGCVLALAGCGGGSGSSGGTQPPPSPPTPTPLGTTMITVTANATSGQGNSSQTVGILVTVTQ